MQTVTRVGGWIRHDATNEKPDGLEGAIELAWFDPMEGNEYRIGFRQVDLSKPNPDGVTIAWDHIFAYRPVNTQKEAMGM